MYKLIATEKCPHTRKELLEAPISSGGPFGPRFRSMVDAMESASEEAESIRRHVSWAQLVSRDRPSQRWVCREQVADSQVHKQHTGCHHSPNSAVLPEMPNAPMCVINEAAVSASYSLQQALYKAFLPFDQSLPWAVRGGEIPRRRGLWAGYAPWRQ